MAIINGNVDNSNVTNIFDGDNGREGYLKRYNTQLLETFNLQPAYFPIYERLVNKSYSTLKIDSWVIDTHDNYKDRIPRKKIIYKPDDKLKLGTIMHIDGWSHETGANQIWLVTEIDPSPLYFNNGQVTKCNNYVKFYKNTGILISEPCVYDIDERNADKVDGNITLINSKVKRVQVQSNSDTRFLKINNRLVFDGYSYKIIDIKNHNKFDLDNVSPLLELVIEKDPPAPDDDLINNIANTNQYKYSLKINQPSFTESIGYTQQLSATLKLNDTLTTQPLTWTSSDITKATIDGDGNISLLSVGSVIITCNMISSPLVTSSITINVINTPIVSKSNLITPNTTYIYEGKSQIYTVNGFTNGVVDTSNFTIIASGLSADYYRLTIINGNSFKIDNLKKNTTKLHVVCTNTNDGTTITIDILLKGLF